jgi:hypothetical protein
VYVLSWNRGPHRGRPEPHTGRSEPIPGARSAHVEVLDQTWRPGPYIYRGLAPSHGGSDTWRHWTRPCGGVRCCCWPRVVARGWGESWPGPTYSSFTTQLKIAACVLRLYTVVRGTLVSRYRHTLCPLMYGGDRNKYHRCTWTKGTREQTRSSPRPTPSLPRGQSIKASTRTNVPLNMARVPTLDQPLLH